MNIKGLGASVFFAVSLMGASAFPQQLADNGTFAIGVDRMFGYVSDVSSYDQTIAVTNPPTSSRTERTVNDFSVLGRTNGVGLSQIPRLSFDAFLGPGVTVGGSVMYDHYSAGLANNGQVSVTKTSTGVWLLSLRVGFAHMFGPYLGIWPRAGIMYAHASTDKRHDRRDDGSDDHDHYYGRQPFLQFGREPDFSTVTAFRDHTRSHV